MPFVSLLLALFLSNTTHATSVVRLDFDSLCVNSERIVRARCVSSDGVVSDDRTGVRTETHFEVLETVKGPDTATLLLSLPGGRVGDRWVTVLGIPTFEAGAEVVLFLSKPDAKGSPWPMGLSQGCYSVSKNRYVLLQRGATPLPDAPAFKPTDSASVTVPVSAFLDEVRAVLDPGSRPTAGDRGVDQTP